jgi:hypothetical protein
MYRQSEQPRAHRVTIARRHRWPKLVIGAVLLWRVSATMLAVSADFSDARLAAEWSSPGLGRAARLAFASYDRDTGGANLT